eukprot:TRINITY_DN15519_c0_g1_i2.p1 TRINITY_DN15519_c0_g1~~TRINITY_DN15519_c0_g1_i2.p1  ORF type:complete len:157 (+),score=19.78 TRINITY_DN15519_c0_g1_i2:191-661(+)
MIKQILSALVKKVKERGSSTEYLLVLCEVLSELLELSLCKEYVQRTVEDLSILQILSKFLVTNTKIPYEFLILSRVVGQLAEISNHTVGGIFLLPLMEILLQLDTDSNLNVEVGEALNIMLSRSKANQQVFWSKHNIDRRLFPRRYCGPWIPMSKA